MWLATLVLLAAACGEPAGPRQISRSNHGAHEVSLTAFGDGFAAAWYDTRDGNPEIYLRLIDAQGRPRAPERRLTNTPDASYEADIKAAHDNLAVAWYEKSADGKLTAMLGLWTRDGERRWETRISGSDRSGRNPVVRVNGRELFCAWFENTGTDGSELWAGWWDLDGQPLSPPRRLAPAGRTTWNLNAAIDGQGRAWVVFDAKADTRSEELFVARADRTSSNVVRLTADDGFSSKYPDLVFGGDRAALTWFDTRDGNEEVYLFVATPDQFSEGLQQGARRVTETRGASIGAYIGWNGERFGLAWSDDTEGQGEVYFQAFDPSGTPLAQPQRLTHNETFSSIPAIQPLNDGFALAWNEYTPEKTDAHESGARSEIVFAFAR